MSSEKQQQQEQPTFVIIGGGVAGLTLALALKAHVNVTATVYEQAQGFDSNAGGAIGLYPNGLRVFRDISSSLFEAIRDAGYPYQFRRWMRHDGTEVACASELVLASGEEPLQSIGIRRWKFQKALLDEVYAQQIPVHFAKRIKKVTEEEESNSNDDEGSSKKKKYKCEFEDGDVVMADLVFGADGVKSKVRESIFGDQLNPEYTGVTCLMGAAPVARPFRGICFPSSQTSKCHACYYPTGDEESVFQIFYPTEEKPETWGTLSEADAKQECKDLADKLRADGWHDDFLEPLDNAMSVIRVGLRARDPLPRWVKGRVVLLGDAAHPPVPYIGQGAMMAVEDVGVLSMLMKKFCLTEYGGFSLEGYGNVTQRYEDLRITRTREILGASHKLGSTQQNRAESWLYNVTREWSIWLQVKLWGTLPVMLPGATYVYSDHLDDEQKPVAAEKYTPIHAWMDIRH